MASRGKPVDPSIVIDRHQQPRPFPHPYPHPHVALNVSLGAMQLGPPPPPTDVQAALQADGNVLVRWTPAPASGRVDHYAVQYRTVGGWLPLTDHLDANATSFLWTTASRGVVYRFRLLSFSRHSGAGLPSNVATLDVDRMGFHSFIHSFL